MFRLRVKIFYVYIIISFMLSVYLFYLISKYSVEKFINYQRNIKSSKFQSRPRIPQIVGHYVGAGVASNVSKDFLNTNNFSPIPGAGENGDPVVIQARDLLKMQQLFQLNRYNLLASDRIALNRSLPDVRKPKCLSKIYPSKLPTTSIIIVFHNEAWSVLLRTVWSVIIRSPRHLIREILLVDDASDRTFLKTALENYVQKLPIAVSILRLNKREGLVAARLMGARVATGDTLTFLDAHCECSPGWLEPLLARVQENPHKVVCPVIDIISDDNFSYIKSFEFHWGAFNWQMHFRWYTLSDEELAERRKDTTMPFHTPSMAGGLFTIDRKYFFDIGGYDEKLKIWGGDNLEMSFRVWQCGGEIEIAPCSHVGHLFRKSSPYTFPGGVSGILNENLARVALVWMDDWAKFFFKFNKGTDEFKSLNVSNRIALKKQLNCKSFDWYLRKVWSQNFFPASNKFFGRIQPIDLSTFDYQEYITLMKKINLIVKNLNPELKWKFLIKYLSENVKKIGESMKIAKHSSYCLQKPKSNSLINQPFGQSFLKKCSLLINILDEEFVIDDYGRIMTDEGVCLDSFRKTSVDGEKQIEEEKKIKMVICGSNKPAQRWLYEADTFHIRNINSNDCLERGSTLIKDDSEDKFEVFLNPCDVRNELQKWMLFPVAWK
ncbi:polypeptide N-acetylgalactosaminyltransferase 3 [Malaya genurostris]|uniref:polypeptide N-acetylgalactosaminyltransferase 3 n=1 Tax=Malaya genurostris TaxID=325434 RepID=UPI0026F3BD23|nr:polypeptide N-acetylgalactosaminyltransferase 3 [Malaya genurostris]